MARGGKGKSYTTEFKHSAIELALRGEQPVTEIASNLGMSAKTLHNWLREERIKSGDSSEKKLSREESVEDELKRLRKENARLKMERDILKKATAYFAKETL
jgi:transposase